jgi:hypothetical protein
MRRPHGRDGSASTGAGQRQQGARLGDELVLAAQRGLAFGAVETVLGPRGA